MKVTFQNDHKLDLHIYVTSLQLTWELEHKNTSIKNINSFSISLLNRKPILRLEPPTLWCDPSHTRAHSAVVTRPPFILQPHRFSPPSWQAPAGETVLQAAEESSINTRVTGEHWDRSAVVQVSWLPDSRTREHKDGHVSRPWVRFLVSEASKDRQVQKQQGVTSDWRSSSFHTLIQLYWWQWRTRDVFGAPACRKSWYIYSEERKVHQAFWTHRSRCLPGWILGLVSPDLMDPAAPPGHLTAPISLIFRGSRQLLSCPSLKKLL